MAFNTGVHFLLDFLQWGYKLEQVITYGIFEGKSCNAIAEP